MSNISEHHERYLHHQQPRDPAPDVIRCDNCLTLLGDRHSDGSVTLRERPVCEGGAR